MNNHSHNGHRKPVAIIVGTRPEAIKLAPVILALAASSELAPVIISTSQHREMVTRVLDSFGLVPDIDLDVMRPRQSLWDLTANLSTGLGSLFHRTHFEAVVVQGDTTSALIGALCAFYHKIPVAHVEAGLRSHDRYSPFPEELNRVLLGRLAAWHFAPTENSRAELLAEGIAPQDIHVCGNTVVDALHWMVARLKDLPCPLLDDLEPDERLILVTIHRRENLGQPMVNVARAIARLCDRHERLRVLLPLHPNPAVREAIVPILAAKGQVRLCEPLDYDAFLSVLQRAYLVLSDSGGVQEEATALGKPVLVLRRETERPEGVRAGTLRLVGTAADDVFDAADLLLSSQEEREKMTAGSSIYGDGRAAAKILHILHAQLLGRSPENSQTIRSFRPHENTAQPLDYPTATHPHR